MPITLWSVEKMYFRQKPSSWCSPAAPEPCEDGCSAVCPPAAPESGEGEGVSREVEPSIFRKITASISRDKARLQSAKSFAAALIPAESFARAVKQTSDRSKRSGHARVIQFPNQRSPSETKDDAGCGP